MLIYFLLFITPAIIFLINPTSKKKNHSDFFLISLVAIFIIGYRHNTGGDWANYYHQFLEIDTRSLIDYVISEARYSNEFGFNAFFWLGYYYADFYLVNTFFAGFSFYALYYFAKNQPYFWLTISIAIPFFVIIMIMGYTRQGLALSTLMIAIPYLTKGKPLHYFIGVIIATSFHNSAIIFIMLATPYFITMNQYRSIGLMIVFPVALLASGSLEEYFITKTQHYIVEAGFEDSYMYSSGALIRILINATAGSIFLIYRKQWQHLFPKDYYIWLLLSIATLLSIPLMYFTSSTAADRISLYLLIVQMAVWPRIIYMSTAKNRQLLMIGCIIAYGSILFIWLNYAINVHMWLPYHHHLLGIL